MTAAIFALNLLLTSSASIFLKIGMSGFSGPLNTTFFYMIKNPWVYMGMGCYVLAFMTYSILLSKINLSIVYPLTTAGTASLLAVSAVLFFGENISVWKLTGIGLVIAAVWCFSR